MEEKKDLDAEIDTLRRIAGLAKDYAEFLRWVAEDVSVNAGAAAGPFTGEAELRRLAGVLREAIEFGMAKLEELRKLLLVGRV